MSDNRDKRRYPRLPREEPLSIRMELPSEEPGKKPVQVYGSSVDMSAKGLQVRLDHEIPQGQEMEIWIVFVDENDAFNLYGRVSWSRQEENHTWVAGIELLYDSPDSQAWDELFR